MTQNDHSKRKWQQTVDLQQDSEEFTSHIEFKSPFSEASGSVTSDEERKDSDATPIPQFTSDRDNFGNPTNTELIVRPIPVRVQEEMSTQDLRGELAPLSEQETTSNTTNSLSKESRPKRVLSSNQLNVLSYETTDVPSPDSCTRHQMPPKRIRFMSIDDILTTAKANDTHYVSRSFALESVEELDLQLGEELKSATLNENSEGLDHAFSNPSPTIPLSTASPRVSPVCVPLLTPPQSPRHSIVEWPSNLVIESALMRVANDIRPLSPASLTDESKMEVTGESATLGDTDCTLTKRLSFITVGSN